MSCWYSELANPGLRTASRVCSAMRAITWSCVMQVHGTEYDARQRWRARGAPSFDDHRRSRTLSKNSLRLFISVLRNSECYLLSCACVQLSEPLLVRCISPASSGKYSWLSRPWLVNGRSELPYPLFVGKGIRYDVRGAIPWAWAGAFCSRDEAPYKAPMWVDVWATNIFRPFERWLDDTNGIRTCDWKLRKRYVITGRVNRVFRQCYFRAQILLLFVLPSFMFISLWLCFSLHFVSIIVNQSFPLLYRSYFGKKIKNSL